VIQRVAHRGGRHDYYLFAAGTGQLLGYYEGLGANGFLVCPDDVYYIAQPPWLIDENAARWSTSAVTSPPSARTRAWPDDQRLVHHQQRRAHHLQLHQRRREPC
jgi:hypothetical protein